MISTTMASEAIAIEERPAGDQDQHSGDDHRHRTDKVTEYLE